MQDCMSIIICTLGMICSFFFDKERLLFLAAATGDGHNGVFVCVCVLMQCVSV